MLLVSRAAAVLALVVGLLSAAHAEVPAPRAQVLGLYDSTDDPGGKAILEGRIRPVLRRMGLALVLHDVSRGLPADDDAAGAIITVFDDEKLRDAQAYVDWLVAQAARQRKIVILDNFGAYRDAASLAWLPHAEVNRVFAALGLVYAADWTEDPRKLRLVAQDKAMLAPGRTIDVAAARFYFRFHALSPEAAHGHVVVERTDVSDGKSLVVATSPGGGMALTGYVMDARGRPLLALGPFLQEALRGSEATAGDRLLVVTTPRSLEAKLVATNLGWVLRYAHLQADTVNVAELGRLRAADLRRYGTLVLAVDDPSTIGPATVKTIERWVRDDGGGLVAVTPVLDDGWRDLFGVTRVGEARDVPGVELRAPLFPGVGGEHTTDELEVVPVEVASDVTVLLAATGGGPPVLWWRRVGHGRVLGVAATLLGDKEWRGALLQALLRARPVAVAPLLGTLVYFVDDCPMPTYGTKREPIASELGMTDADFYRDVFWPELMRLAQDFGLRLTFGAVFSYEDTTQGGFTTREFYLPTGAGVPVWLAHAAVRLGHEVGLHGLNHQSLVGKAGPTSRGWPDRRRMIEGLQVARAEWERVFGAGQAPRVYVAPHNHIDRDGKEAVHKVFPEVRSISAAYLDDDDLQIIGQELGPDPEVPSVMAFPRMSSELFLTPARRAEILNGIMLHGAFIHFIHPDDIYDPERANHLGWKALLGEGRAMLTWIRGGYPWLEPVAASVAVERAARYRANAFDHQVAGTVLHVRAVDEKALFLVRVDPGRKTGSVRGGTVVFAAPELGVYIIRAKGPETTFELAAEQG